ncbi:MAG: ATP-binding protein [Chloroflexota bacterium]
MIMNLRMTVIGLWILCLGLISACGQVSQRVPRSPQVEAGVLDLRDWNFEQDGLIKLNGNWEFYESQFLTVNAFAPGTTSFSPDYIQVPAAWRGYQIDEQVLSGDGYATLRLTVLLNPASSAIPQIFALDVPARIDTAHALYIDGHLFGSVGHVGQTAGTMTPQFLPYNVSFVPESDQVEIVIHLSNFYTLQGGIRESIYFGPQAQLYDRSQQQLIFTYFLIGSIFIMGLYHLTVFALRRNERSPLYFGLFCLTTAGRVLIMDQPWIIDTYFGFSWRTYSLSILLLVYVASVSFSLFAYSLFPNVFSKRMLQSIIGLTIALSLVTLFSSPKIYTNLVPISIYSISIGLYIVYIVGASVIRQQEGALIFLVGNAAFLLTIIHDVLFFNGLIDTGQMLPLGLFMLIFSQAYVLSSRSAKSFAKNETLTSDLKRNNQFLRETQAELRHSEIKYRSLFEDSKDLIFITGLDGRIEEINSICFELFGYTRAEAKQMNALSFFSDSEDGQRFQDAMTQAGLVRDFALKMRDKQGQEIDCQITATLRYNEAGNTIGYQGIVRDMTAYKQAELEQARALAMQRDKEAADAANQAKSTFLANMSHELRTPLNAVLGFSRLLTRSETMTANERENLHIITRSGEHLLTLINQVLDLSKIESGQIMRNEAVFDLSQMLAELEGMFRLRAESKGLRLIIDLAPTVPRHIFSDELRLRQVLINLLNNALKFTEQGQVKLSVYMGEQINSPQPFTPITFAISDTGPGIPSQELKTLFEPFTQTPLGRSQEGTGLGLSISYRLVDLLGGTLRVKSPSAITDVKEDTDTVGPGTCFHFTLPVSVDLKKAQQTEPSRNALIPELNLQVVGLEPDQPIYRILIVDDHPDNRQLLVKLLAAVGFDVREAQNGQQAVEVWQAWQPHLVWMDMQMPVMDGYQATKLIKSQHSDSKTVIIALTASRLLEAKSDFLDVGCDDLVYKPFREIDIFQCMSNHLGVRYRFKEVAINGQIDVKPLRPDDLAKLPVNVRDQLMNAIEYGHTATLDTLLEEIHLRYPDLVLTLKQHLDNFDYDTVLNCLAQVEEAC